MTTPGDTQIKFGAKVVARAEYIIFQLAGLAVPRRLSAAMPRRIGRLRHACASG